MTARASQFTEHVPMSAWFNLVLIGSMAVLVGSVIAVIVSGDLTGAAAVFFYISMAAAMLILLVVVLNFRRLDITVDDAGLEFGFGRFRKQFLVGAVRGVDAHPYSMMTYGGWGIRYSTRGRRAWSVPFMDTGIVVKVIENGKDREFYVSSNRPDELAAAIERLAVTAAN